MESEQLAPMSPMKETIDNFKTRYANVIQHHTTLKNNIKTEEEGQRYHKLSVYGSVVSVDEYWFLQPVSRWWWSQSRENIYNHFDEEFWKMTQFMEECLHVLEKSRDEVPTKKLVEYATECVEFLDELLPALQNLKSVYPEFDEFNELLDTIVDILRIYHDSIDRELSFLSRGLLVEELSA